MSKDNTDDNKRKKEKKTLYMVLVNGLVPKGNNRSFASDCLEPLGASPIIPIVTWLDTAEAVLI